MSSVSRLSCNLPEDFSKAFVFLRSNSFPRIPRGSSTTCSEIVGPRSQNSGASPASRGRTLGRSPSIRSAVSWNPVSRTRAWNSPPVGDGQPRFSERHAVPMQAAALLPTFVQRRPLRDHDPAPQKQPHGVVHGAHLVPRLAAIDAAVREAKASDLKRRAERAEFQTSSEHGSHFAEDCAKCQSCCCEQSSHSAATFPRKRKNDALFACGIAMRGAYEEWKGDTIIPYHPSPSSSSRHQDSLFIRGEEPHRSAKDSAHLKS